jgi:hypothetical protein
MTPPARQGNCQLPHGKVSRYVPTHHDRDGTRPRNPARITHPRRPVTAAWVGVDTATKKARTTFGQLADLTADLTRASTYRPSTSGSQCTWRDLGDRGAGRPRPTQGWLRSERLHTGHRQSLFVRVIRARTRRSARLLVDGEAIPGVCRTGREGAAAFCRGRALMHEMSAFVGTRRRPHTPITTRVLRDPAGISIGSDERGLEEVGRD